MPTTSSKNYFAKKHKIIVGIVFESVCDHPDKAQMRKTNLNVAHLHNIHVMVMHDKPVLLKNLIRSLVAHAVSALPLTTEKR